jgi:NAD(P)-dependent dehydrogenase (short-subunit alcohol dehydrogenase family)
MHQGEESLTASGINGSQNFGPCKLEIKLSTRLSEAHVGHVRAPRRGCSPYDPSNAALESKTIIWSQDLAGTGVTVNASARRWFQTVRPAKHDQRCSILQS